MKEIQVFNHTMFGEIRAMTANSGEVLFVGKDVATALGYAKSRNALATHVDEEDKTSVANRDTGSNYKSKAVRYGGTYAFKEQDAERIVHRQWCSPNPYQRIGSLLAGALVEAAAGEGVTLHGLLFTGCAHSGLENILAACPWPALRRL